MTWLGIDGTNWIHTLWSACGADAVDVAAKRLAAVVALVRPTVTAICFDRRSFRCDLLPSYKQGRRQKDDGLRRALACAEQELGRHGAIVFDDGYEADDCLATLAKGGVAAGQQVVLASPDKDLRQCLTPGFVILLTAFRAERGICQVERWFTAKCLRGRYGLTPGQRPDYQALVGDTTDGIAGCPGWGEATATRVLAKCGTLAAALANPWSCPVTDRQRDALLKFKPRAELVLQLVTLRTDVAAVYDALR